LSAVAGLKTGRRRERRIVFGIDDAPGNQNTYVQIRIRIRKKLIPRSACGLLRTDLLKTYKNDSGEWL
jgi:hypothetical protein